MKSQSTPSKSFSSGVAPQRSFSSGDGRVGFVSTIPQDRRFKVEDLFKFKRGRADLLFSLIVAAFTLFLLANFSVQSMWDHREIPGDEADYSFADYMVYQTSNAALMTGAAFQAWTRGEPLGAKARKKNDPKLKALPRLDWPYEGRLPRFGKILLKAPWLMPLAFMVLLVPAVVFNILSSYQAARKRARERRPNLTLYELGYWGRALEYVAYFIAYTFLVTVLGYLVSTVLLVTLLTCRQGYRSPRWIATAFLSAFAIVLVFRTALQIKTPNTIWLYNLLPTDARAFMLTYF